MVQVVLLYAEGCPNRRSVEDQLERLAAELGFDLSCRTVTELDEAERSNFPGSPTVLIDGEDPFPSAGGASLSCRLYGTGAGLRGVPPKDELHAALRRAVENDGTGP